MVNWQKLALDPDFQSLFSEDVGNPLRSRIRSLEENAVSLSVTDPLKMMAIKGELQGIRSVLRTVMEMADAVAKEVKGGTEKKQPQSLSTSTPTTYSSSSPPPSPLRRFLGRIGA